MTRRDFQLIADVLVDVGDQYGAQVPIAAVAREFAKRLRATNERFDADRFIRAATRETVAPMK